VRVELRTDCRHVRRWQLELIHQLQDLPDCELNLRHKLGQRLPRLADSLFELETLIYGIPPGHPAEIVNDAEIFRDSAGVEEPDLVVDLTGDSRETDDIPALVPKCNGMAPEYGALKAILAGEAPVITLDLFVGGAPRGLARWHVAIEDHGVATRAFENIFGRAVQAIVKAISDIHSAQNLRSVMLYVAGTEVASKLNPSPIPLFFARTLKRKIEGRIARLLSHAPRWHTGWRFKPAGNAILNPLDQTFRRISDDGERFFADPFLWEHEGITYLFMEEYPYSTAKGRISVSEFVEGRTFTRPRPVLESLDVHLSYPFLIREQGITYMIPETSARNTVELWRCVSFPDRWEREHVLVSGHYLLDATIVRSGEIWYMFAAQKQKWTSSWDALAIWCAPSLFGPWSAHPSNPVVVNAGAARPAGNLFFSAGHLVRPAQDCTKLYGGGLSFAIVNHLSPTFYQQSTMTSTQPTRGYFGPHTYNRLDNLEVVDLFGRSSGNSLIP
jgi:hypothetical protein